MSDIRSLIREILAEELAAFRGAMQAIVERVRIRNGSDLTGFARNLLARAEENPGFARDVREGRVLFELDDAGRESPVTPEAAPRRETAPAVPELMKPLITERDLAGVDRAVKRIKVKKTSRLTPLAQDELRRRGIKLERVGP